MDYPHRLPWIQRIAFGVGHSLNDLCATMWFSYLIIYLTLVLNFDSNYAGFLLLIGQVTDAIATPLLGYEASRVTEGTGLSAKYGKRKFLHLIGTIFVAASFPFIFSVCPGCENASESALTTMLAPLVIIFQIGWAAIQVSHLSLIPVITPYETERDFLNVLRYSFNIVSDMGTYVIVWCVFDLTRQVTGDRRTISADYASKFMNIVLIIVGIGTFFSIIFHVGVKEVSSLQASVKTKVSETNEPQSSSNQESPLEVNNLSWKGWLKEVHFYQVGLLYMLARLYNNMSYMFVPLYLQESLHASADFIAKIPLVMNVSGFVISCSLPKFYKTLNKRMTFLGGATIGLVASAWISVGYGPGYATKGIYGVGALMGAASSMLVVSSLSFTHDLIGTSPETGAFVYGCMSFCDKLANGIVGMIIQHMHAVSCKDCDWFYRDVLAYGVGGMAMLCGLTLFTLLGAKLGERKSIYNSAIVNLRVDYKITEEQTSEELNEKDPLLKK